MSKPHTITSARTALGLAVALAMGATALPGAAHAQQNTGGTVQAEQHYDISAGPLSQVLNRFADQAGVALSFDAARLGQRRSEGWVSSDGFFSECASSSNLRFSSSSYA